MNKPCKIFLGMLALSAVLLSGCAKDKTEQPPENLSGPEAAGETSPSESEPSSASITFEGTDLEGNAVTSSIFSQSRLTMVNVWATYCNPCLNEMPALGELAADYETEEFQIIGIVSDVLEGEDTSLTESLVEQTGAHYTHLLLNESIYDGLLTDVTAVPTTFFLDKDGVILDTVIGAMEKSGWEEKINGLLEKD
ncbi:MAG: TlpA family protein disulfide reductase [Provencibacterium sp.]|nr:TlpA family protein disulfide reductase [Provencibacterium sp.]